jgi:hypothetical protein
MIYSPFPIGIFKLSCSKNSRKYTYRDYVFIKPLLVNITAPNKLVLIATRILERNRTLTHLRASDILIDMNACDCHRNNGKYGYQE